MAPTDFIFIFPLMPSNGEQRRLDVKNCNAGLAWLPRFDRNVNNRHRRCDASSRFSGHIACCPERIDHEPAFQCRHYRLRAITVCRGVPAATTSTHHARNHE
jgi:hypothetical protein